MTKAENGTISPFVGRILDWYKANTDKKEYAPAEDPGVVLAYIIGIPFAIGAFIAGLLCAVTTGFLDDNSRPVPYLQRGTAASVSTDVCLLIDRGKPMNSSTNATKRW